MRLTLSRCRILVGLAFLCGGSGCLEFEKQTMVFVFPKDGKEIRALFVYHGLRVGGGGAARAAKANLARAKTELARLASGKSFYLGYGLAEVSLAADDNEKIDPEVKKRHEVLNRHLTVHPGFFVPRMGVDLAFCQPITVKQPAEFVPWLNEKVSQIFSGEILVDKDSLWDRKTVDMLQKAARDGHAWLQLDPGRVRFTMPGSQPFFAKFKRTYLGLGLESKPAATAEQMRQERDDFSRWLTFWAETPWSLEQKPKQLTLSLGWGDGLPFRLVFDHGRRPADNQQNKDLLAHAQTLGVPFRKDVSIDELLDEFQRTGKVK